LPFPRRLSTVRAEHKVAVILIIDDEYSITEVLEAALSDAGHDVISAMNGDQGLERLRQHPPDLVLLDLMMPIMDGAAMLKIMRSDETLRDIPVIIMSSLPEAAVGDAEKGLYTAFLRKPFKLGMVLELAGLVLDRGHGNS
jgi:CheY-like chemotaxis protein